MLGAVQSQAGISSSPLDAGPLSPSSWHIGCNADAARLDPRPSPRSVRAGRVRANPVSMDPSPAASTRPRSPRVRPRGAGRSALGAAAARLDCRRWLAVAAARTGATPYPAAGGPSPEPCLAGPRLPGHATWPYAPRRLHAVTVAQNLPHGLLRRASAARGAAQAPDPHCDKLKSARRTAAHLVESRHLPRELQPPEARCWASGFRYRGESPPGAAHWLSYRKATWSSPLQGLGRAP